MNTFFGGVCPCCGQRDAGRMVSFSFAECDACGAVHDGEAATTWDDVEEERTLIDNDEVAPV